MVLGGPTVGGATLGRFYAFPVFIAPGLIFAFIGLHLYLIIHNGISEPPSTRPEVVPETYRASYEKRLQEEGRPYWPDAIWKEIAFGVLVIIAVILLAVILGPKPLGQPPDPSQVTVNPQPDWFFRWYYALLTLKPEGLEDFVMVYGPILIGLFLLLIPFFSNRGKRTWIYRPWSVGTIGFIVVSMIVLTMIGMRPYWVPDFETEPLPVEMLPVTDEKVIAGAELFHLRGCQYCHQVMGRGGNYGPDLTDVRKRLSPEIIAVRIITGVGEMPAYRTILTSEELDAIIAFLTALGEPTTIPLQNSGP
jgi:ubiquinol-cytochrome c reductase cytochrome b subunit